MCDSLISGNPTGLKAYSISSIPMSQSEAEASWRNVLFVSNEFGEQLEMQKEMAQKLRMVQGI
jgi:hypothetical protein